MRIRGILLPRDGGGKKVELIDWENLSINTATDDLADMMAMRWYSDRRGRIELALPDLYHTTLRISLSSPRIAKPGTSPIIASACFGSSHAPYG
jgi:hypothetical protein